MTASSLSCLFDRQYHIVYHLSTKKSIYKVKLFIKHHENVLRRSARPIFTTGEENERLSKAGKEMSSFYTEGDSELVRKMTFRMLLHLQNKFRYTTYRLPFEVYTFW